MVEHVGFKVFVKNLKPHFELVTLNKLEADCLEIYYKDKQKVGEELDRLLGRICVCIDVWDSKENDLKYFCLAAHFIDETWQIRKKLLSFMAIDSSHTISSSASKMKSKFDNYWGKCNFGLAIAAFWIPDSK
ncbi:hypothetical protein MLD38_033285 [Melastoma candidum]|uniref:Uncharacterized protein n=1 Tax=Melastoma candidum TaxID=119954 RepID=A0ACB9M6T7_9MYRT|nr:hypothetical protein MLD38_033285 [Melastoma candidum]